MFQYPEENTYIQNINEIGKVNRNILNTMYQKLMEPVN